MINAYTKATKTPRPKCGINFFRASRIKVKFEKDIKQDGFVRGRYKKNRLVAVVDLVDDLLLMIDRLLMNGLEQPKNKLL